jgi:hypothetical protein
MRPARALRGPLTLIFLVPILAAAAVLPRAAFGGPFDDRPKLLLHVRQGSDAHCFPGPALGINDCANANVTGPVMTSPTSQTTWVYVLAAPGRIDDLAGVQFGIDYQAGANPATADQDGAGLDIFAWTMCATLEFTTPGASSWPRPGAGTIVTWDSTTRCQVGDLAIVGFFYVGVYGPDVLRLTERPVDGAAKVADCDAVEYRLQPRDLGRASFGNAGGGCNPCVESCAGGGGDGQEPPAALVHIAAAGSSGDVCAVARPTFCGGAVVTADRRITSTGFAFLLAEPGGNHARVRELRAGVNYQGGAESARRDRRGLDILGWTLCADAEAPTIGDRPWPAPGSGNVISWDPAEICSQEGPAVAGYFYVAAYAADTLRVVAHPDDAFVTMTRCTGAVAQLAPERTGFAVWSDGQAVGCNPCLGPCPTGVAVQPATWSRIKTLPRGR